MKFNIILVVLIATLSSCVSLVPEAELSMWASANGYIHKDDIPATPEVPVRQALPHPDVPKLELEDEDGNYTPITIQYLMKTSIILFGTVVKYQYLAEIYEREYLNTGGKIMKDLSLDELTSLYLEKVRDIETLPDIKATEVDAVTGFPSTGSAIEYITDEEFAETISEFNKAIE